ncbi:MAG: LamG-like jellyroll fold domain-containing protein [Steroidobacteraceae bacterium]
MTTIAPQVSFSRLRRLGRVGAAALAIAALTACSNGGAPTQENQVTQAPPVADYTGPAPANADIQAFKLSLWDNVKANNRCGSCHNAGGQVPTFARNDDVNLAYQAANTVANLTQPDQSRLVTKVASGHNCWLSSPAACGDIMTTWIRNWAGATAGGGTVIQLQAPEIKDVGASRTFPADSALFASTIYPLLRTVTATAAGAPNCARCHSPAASTPQSPFFASNDVDAAYAAVKAQINLDTPASSRLVVRLRDEFHNCWTDCGAAATDMLNRVTAFQQGIPLTQVDPSLVISKALTLYDGTVAAGGNRYDGSVIAKYEFKTGKGNTIFDTSGVEPALNLTMSGDITWVGGWGVNVKATGKAQGTATNSKKLADLIKSTGEFSLEVWAVNGNVAQEDAYIASYSAGAMARNVTLSQREYQYEALTRSDKTDANGNPSMLTRAADEDAQASLQHVVLTYSPVGGRRIYVNGRDTGDVDAQGGGSLRDWDDTFALVLGNETSNNRQWTGVLRLAAVHNRALTPEQIQQNFEAGVGEKYFLLFNVSHLVNVPQAYMMFQASQLDSYGYLFERPTFISLDGSAQIPSIPIAGMRIGVNGIEAKSGQAYVPLNATVSSSNYLAGAGQKFTDHGTVVPVEKGAESDLFFLSFERIGDNTHARTEGPPVVTDPVPDAAIPAESDIGLRTFEEINMTLSNITGIPTNNPEVVRTYTLVRQALPTTEKLGTFGPSQQTGIAQLAIQYCNQLVQDDTRRTNFFGAINLATPANSFFAGPGRDQVINALLTKGAGTGLNTQPNTEIATEVNSLIDRLTAGAAGTQAGRTAVVITASCATVLGSATTLVQ